MSTISVRFEKVVKGRAGEVWNILSNIYGYPDYMPSVLSVEKCEIDGIGCSKWEISARGHIVNWISRDDFADSAMRYKFKQVEGDFAYFCGHWQVTVIDEETSRLSFAIDFDIGIPVLADTLHPILRDVLTENLEEIASCIQKQLFAFDL